MTELWFDLTETVGLFLLDTTIKATVLVALVLLAVRLCSANRAAWRNLLLNLGMVGLLLIPLAAGLMPSLRLPILPKPSSVLVLKAFTELSGVNDEAPAALSQNKMETTVSPATRPMRPSDRNLQSPALSTRAYPPSARNVPASSVVAADRLPIVLAVGVSIYLAGLVVMLIRLVGAVLYVFTLRRSLTDLNDSSLKLRMDKIKQRLGIRRKVALASSDRIGSPTQIGILDPIIVIPENLIEKKALDVIFIHELVHVRRLDCLFKFISSLSLAFYWFHPLVWIASRRLSVAQEQACDDWSIVTTGDSDSYAGVLLDVTSAMQPIPAVSMGMDMARQGGVMDRIDRIVSIGKRVSPHISRGMWISVAAAVVLAAVTLGTVKATVFGNRGTDSVSLSASIDTAIQEMGGLLLPLFAKDGSVWGRSSMHGEIIRFDGKEKTTYGPADGLMDGWTTSMLQAEDGTLWFSGSHEAGTNPALARYDGKDWEITTHDRSIGPAVYALCFDSKENIWMRAHPVGDEGHGVTRFDGKNWRNFRVEDGLSHNRVYSAADGRDGSVWVGTRLGISRFDGKQWTSYTREDGLGGKKTYEILVAQDGKVWGTHSYRNGISVFDGASWKTLNEVHGLPAGGASAICQIKDGTIWMGTSYHHHGLESRGGLLRYQDGGWLLITSEDGLPAGHVNGIRELNDGRLLLGVRYVGWVPYRPSLDNLGSVSGRVTREDGSPWPGAGIRVEDEEGWARSGATTSIDGSFRAPVFPGQIRVSVVYGEGVEPLEFAVEAGESIKGLRFVPTRIRRGDAVLTTRLGGPGGNKPMDEIKEISIAKGKVYAFVNWGVPREEADIACKIYDGAGRLVAEHDLQGERWPKETIFEYEFDRSLDKPGKWRFEVYLDGKKDIEKTLTVLSAPRDPVGERKKPVVVEKKEIEVLLPDLTGLDGIGVSIVGSHREPREKLKLPATDRPAYFYETGHRPAVGEDRIISVMVIPQKDGDRFYVDLNNDEDLTNDGSPGFFPRDENDFVIWLADREDPKQKTARLWQRRPHLRHLPDDHPSNKRISEMLASYIDTVSGDLLAGPAGFWKRLYPDFTGEVGTYYFRGDLSMRRGRVTVNQSDYEIGLWDLSGNGLYNDEGDFLIIDLDREGGLKRWARGPSLEPTEVEVFKLNDVFTIGEENYKLSFVHPYGERMTLSKTGEAPTFYHQKEMAERDSVRREARSKVPSPVQETGQIPASFWEGHYESISGETVDLESLRGQYALLNFWGEWCPPCIQEIPSLVIMNRKIRKDKLKMVSFVKVNKLPDAKRVVERFEMDWPQVLADSTLIGALKVKSWPTNILVLKDGTYLQTGRISEAFLEKHIQ